LPVVASAILPFQEVVEHKKNGLLFDPLNPDDLAKTINELFENKHSLEKYAQASMETMKTSFSWTDIAASYKNLLS